MSDERVVDGFWCIEDESLGLTVDLTAMALDPDAMEVMAPRLARAGTAMAALESGFVANPDENRRVGHYWLRAPELAPEPALTAAIHDALAQIKAFAARVHSGELGNPLGARFAQVLVIGIGGSTLGPQYVSHALGGAGDRMRAAFIDNTDPDGIDRVVARLRAGVGLAATLTVVISKSGGTKETRNGMLEVARAYEGDGLSFAQHAVAVTGEGSELDRLARAQGWREVFPMWDWVGGRTSVTSAVGLLPAALQGLDIAGILEGACACDAQTRVADLKQNPAAQLALAWYFLGEGRGSKDMVVLPYKDRLELFSRYLQQLVMESLGKELDLDGRVVNQGLAVYGNKGSTDQHAYVQQLREGVLNFFAVFIEVLSDRSGSGIEVEPGVTSGDFLSGFFLGTRDALYEKGRQSLTITVDRVTGQTVGALIALFERAVGLYASLVRINAYHQPGVEAGKKAASVVLALQRKAVDRLKHDSSTAYTAGDLATALGTPEAAEGLFKILSHLAANGRITRAGGSGVGTQFRG